MDENLICQSCSMPIDDPELRGTEWDGTKSSEYCKYCYQEGQFTMPGLLLDEMKTHMKESMDNHNLSYRTIQRALKLLPHLKRWESEVAKV